MAEENKNTGGTQPEGAQQPAPAFDYDKLASIVEGRQKANEESVLKGYFKQQGITGEEAQQAIAAFKKQKADNTPDIGAMQSQLASYQTAAQEAMISNQALLMAGSLGVDIKTMPYVVKMADLSEVIVEGKVSEDKLKAAIEKVLEDIPQLKTKTEGAAGGFKIGKNADEGNGGTSDAELMKIFGIKG